MDRIRRGRTKVLSYQILCHKTSSWGFGPYYYSGVFSRELALCFWKWELLLTFKGAKSS